MKEKKKERKKKESGVFKGMCLINRVSQVSSSCLSGVFKSGASRVDGGLPYHLRETRDSIVRQDRQAHR